MTGPLHHTYRRRQSGNMVLTLFALVAGAGILGATTMTLLRGPVASSALLSKQKIAATAMEAAARLVGRPGGPTTDCDGDGALEPVAWHDAPGLASPAGGGLLPPALGAAKADPWRAPYGYCVWDHGPLSVGDDIAGCGGSTAHRLGGGDTRIHPVIAIISAGPDRQFQTGCRAWSDTDDDGEPDQPLIVRDGGSDDLVHTETLDTLVRGGSGAQLPYHPDAACTADTIGLMRFEMDTVQVCTEYGWEEVGAQVAADGLFDPVHANDLAAQYTSNAITFSGYFGTRTATVDGGALIIVNGTVIGATAPIAAGDTVALQAAAAATPATVTTYTLRMGGITRPWVITTRDPTPASLSIQPTAQTDMDVTGPGTPAYGATVSFLVRNTGETPTTLIAAHLSNTDNFEFSSTGVDVGDDCNGKTLGLDQTCVIDVKPQASAGGPLSGTLTASDGTVSAIASLSGTAAGWGCPLPWGGTIETGDAVTAYTHILHPDCASASQARTCAGGALDGDEAYRFQTCQVFDPQPGLHVWGEHANGKTGLGGTTGYQLIPAQIGTGSDWTAIGAAQNKACGVRAGKLYCWGANTEGATGLGTTTGNQTTPAQVGSATGWTVVAPGRYHSCGIRAGELYCWGRGNAVGSYGGATSTPRRVGTDSDWTHVAVGTTHSCGIRSGRLYCWGPYSNGAGGFGIATGSNQTPAQVGTDSDWTLVDAGNSHMCGIRSGALYCWGSNQYGATGLATTAGNQLTPAQVGTDTGWTAITAAHYHTCGIRSGNVYCWGYDFFGRVGQGADNGTHTTPGQVGADNDWTHVSADNTYTCGIRAQRLYCWGPFLITSANTPYEIGATTTWEDVALGYNFTLAINGPITIGPDTTPDPFSFTDQTDVALNTQIPSNTITISGIDAATPVSASGEGSPRISIDGGSWVTSGTISNGQSLRVRLTSSPDNETTRTATVDVGGLTAQWNVTTIAGPSLDCQSEAGGYCWFAAPGAGVNCNTTCAALDAVCDLAAMTQHVGSGNGMAGMNCRTLIQQTLGITTMGMQTQMNGTGPGCMRNNSTNKSVVDNHPIGCSATPSASHTVICACKPDGG